MTNVLQLNKKQLDQMEDFYRDDMKNNTNQYILFSVRSASINAYTSGKVVFQGSAGIKEYSYWIKIFDMEDDIASKEAIYYTSSIGSDEVGKGDYFGPLVVCSAYVPQKAMHLVRELGIKDSKKITDDKIRIMAKKIKDHVEYSVLVLNNAKYNELSSKGYSVVKMMAKLHNRAISNVVNKVGTKVNVYIDQFAEPGVYYRYLQGEKDIYKNAKFTTKAESKHSSVAVASIIARYKFLDEMDQLSTYCDVTIPKGANELVDKTIAKLIRDKGESFLYNVGKIGFANTEKAKKYLS